MHEWWENYCIMKKSTKEPIRSFWYTKDMVNFVEQAEGIFLVKFGLVEDRDHILNLAPWFFH